MMLFKKQHIRSCLYHINLSPKSSFNFEQYNCEKSTKNSRKKAKCSTELYYTTSSPVEPQAPAPL